HCHAGAQPGPLPPGVLDWGSVISSPQVRAALASLAAAQAARLGAWLGALPAAGPAGYDVPRAAACLMEARSAALQADAECPVPPAAGRLVAAVPSTQLPPRRPPEAVPRDPEAPGTLCQGIAGSAARLRAATLTAAAEAAWSPAASASGWRWSAVSGAVA